VLRGRRRRAPRLRRLARKVAKKRLLEAPAGIDYIITACPMCHANLQDAGGKVLDISELVLMSMI